MIMESLILVCYQRYDCQRQRSHSEAVSSPDIVERAGTLAGNHWCRCPSQINFGQRIRTRYRERQRLLSSAMANL